MTPKGGHVQPAHAEPRIGRSHEFHHFAGGLPAATFVGERTFRWRRVGSNPCDYIHAPLPRRERVAALLTLRPGTVQCNRAGIRSQHDSTSVPTCKRMKRRGFRLTPISFDRGILPCTIRLSGVRFCDGLRVQPMPDNLTPGSAAWLTQVPGRVCLTAAACVVSFPLLLPVSRHAQRGPSQAPRSLTRLKRFIAVDPRQGTIGARGFVRRHLGKLPDQPLTRGCVV